MFLALPKSQTAKEKMGKLSHIELVLLDMYITAAFTRPDSYITIVDTTAVVVGGSVFEIFVIQIPVAMVSMTFGPSGKMAVLDFVVTCDLLEHAVSLAPN